MTALAKHCGFIVAVSALCSVACIAEAAEPSRSTPHASYETLKSLPDWQGWWGLESPVLTEFRTAPAPLKPELVSALQTVMASDAGGGRDLYCRPSQFTGYSGGFVESVEFLFTPGRVTLTNESGLIRRIYTDGRSLPRDVDASNTGLSVGHWEGQTLVVETTRIDPKALYPQPFSGAIPVGRDVKIVERISLRDPDTLQFVISTTAPDIFTAPDQRTRVYSRVPNTHSAADQLLFGLRPGGRSSFRQAAIRYDAACRLATAAV